MKEEWNTKPIKGNTVAYLGVTIKPEWKDCVWSVIIWREKKRRKVNKHLFVVWVLLKNRCYKIVDRGEKWTDQVNLFKSTKIKEYEKCKRGFVILK